MPPYIKRLRNTHSVRATQSGFLDTYNIKTGITSGTVSIPVKPDEIVTTIVESIKLLGEYTTFIEKIIEEYYDHLYEEYKKMNESDDIQI